MSSFIEKIKVFITGDNKKLKDSVKDSEKSLNGFGKTIKRIGGLLAGAFAVSKLTAFTRASLKAYDTQAQAENRLLVALKGRTDLQQKLIAQAQQLQRTTLFGDEETIQAQALAASMGLTFEQIQKLIPAAQNLAAAQNQTLEFGVRNLAKTYGGLAGELGESILQLRELTQEEMKAGKAIDLVNELMAGQAEAASEIGTGGLTQFKTIMGDLTEEVGYAIIELTDMNEKLGDFSTIIAGIDLKKTVDEYTEWRKENETTNKVLTSLLSPLKAINNYNRFIIDTGKGVAKRFGWVKDEAFELNYELSSIEDNLKGINTEGGKVVKTAEDIAKEFEEWKKVNAELTANREAKEALNDVDIGLRNSLSETLGILGGTHEEFIAATGAAEGLTDGMFDLGLSLAENEERISEPGVDNLIEQFNKGEDAALSLEAHLGNLSHQVVSLAGHVAGDLAFAFGQAGAGLDNFGDTLAQLGIMIADSLGNILIATGIEVGLPQGIPLILLGLGLKGYAGFASAMHSKQDYEYPDYSNGELREMELVIRGSTLTNANSQSAGLVNRLG